jgi:HEAT repeat protein
VRGEKIRRPASRKLCYLGLAAILFANLLSAQQQSASDPYDGLAKFTFGQSRLPLAQIEEQIRQTAPADYSAIEAKLLVVLKGPETPKDAKRYICRWLGIVGSAACVPAVAELLSDADLSHPARMALEPLATPAASAALRNALPKLQGKLLAGVISSLGIRRDPEAVPALSRLAADNDALVAGTALAALGEIGTAEAARTLDDLRVSESLSRTKARAQVAAAGHLAASGQRPAAAAIYRMLTGPQQSQAIRIAALNGLIGALPQAEAVRLVVEMVQGEDDAMRTATIAAYTRSPDQALKNAVAAELPAMKPAGQLLLLGVLADQPDIAARGPVLQVLGAAEPSALRVAALECLVRHGEAPDVPQVVRLAAGQPAEVAEAARRVLQRMGKPGVNEALVRLIESPAPAERAVVLSALASRRVESALPVLVRLVGGADAALAAEAAKALGVMGQGAQLTDLAAVLVRTENAALRSAAEDAMKAITSRAPDKAAASVTLLGALLQTSSPPARAAVIRLLGQTGGAPALAAVVKAMQDKTPEVRDAAFRTLVAWPEASAAPHLIEVARSTSKPNEAIVALREGCLRLADMDEVPMAERLTICRSVLETAQRTEEKKQTISALGQMASPGALDVLLTCAKDPALRNDAITAGIRVARQIGGVFPKQAMTALQAMKAQADSDDLRKKVDDAIKALQNAGQSPDGFILAWMFSGPYTQEGKDGSALFDLAFPPEKPGAKADWRPVTGAKSGLLELDKMFRGNDRVAYLRTRITSDQAQDARLELGSDDGVKVWLNDKVVHANNAIRPCSPGQDKVKVKLQAGANDLLLKVTQGGGEWSVICRLRGADGGDLGGVTVGPTE